ncbi:Uncharacterized protein FWK35_00011314 [Aphis craccivora]|uniref:Uncharacterized protein n=1 Tax=Aphis craccivora TaxID=307492 RepID=A0A6G0Z7N7_APHCR|nr:Uncharacterized protein FWK35_00011314 [Aphis craccivora]
MGIIHIRELYEFLDSEQSDFTMMCVLFFVSVNSITSRNNVPISNFGGGFRCKSEYPWCIIEVKSKHFPTVFKKMMEKREFLHKISFRPNRFLYIIVIPKLNTVNT